MLNKLVPKTLTLFRKLTWTRLGKQLWEWRAVLIVTPTVTGILLVMRLAGWLQPLELWAFDLSLRSRPSERADERVVIVGINDADIEQLGGGKWYIPDAVIAQVLEKLKKQQPKAIGLDLFRNAPLDSGYQALIKVFQTTPNLIGIEKKIGDRYNPAIAPNPVLSQLSQVASVDVVLDPDNRLRRGMLYVQPEGGEPVASLGLTLALMYLEAEGIYPEASPTGLLQLGRTVFVPFEANDGGYVGADAGGYQILLNFRGPAGSFHTVSLTDVLENRISPNWGRDRIVLIGATSASKLRDVFDTPYTSSLMAIPQPTPGIEIQANLISQILSSVLQGRPLIRVWSEPLEWLWIFGWSCLGATLSWTSRYAGELTRSRDRWLSLNLSWTTISIIWAGGSLIGGCYLAFMIGGWWIPVVPAVLAISGSAICITGYIANLERQDRQTVMNLFGRHVSTEIAHAIWQERHQLLKQGRLPGKKMTATVLFTDLQNFSSIAEHTEPEVLMFWLNQYMEAMAQVVLDCGGVVDKFIGDSIMAVFGVPIQRTTDEPIAEDAFKAINCALTMATKLQFLNKQWQTQGQLTAAMRVGIATGTVIVGSLGSSQRLEYATLGDSVNVASRLESYDKFNAQSICRILINEETYRYTQNKFPTQKIGSVQLKGRQQPTTIYQVLLQ